VVTPYVVQIEMRHTVGVTDTLEDELVIGYTATILAGPDRGDPVVAGRVAFRRSGKISRRRGRRVSVAFVEFAGFVTQRGDRSQAEQDQCQTARQDGNGAAHGNLPPLCRRRVAWERG